MDGFFAALLFLDLTTTTTTAAGGFFFAAFVIEEEEEHPGSGCGALFFNFGGFFAALLLFAIEEDDGSGFGFALGLALDISSRGERASLVNLVVLLLIAVLADEPPEMRSFLDFFAAAPAGDDPITCCDTCTRFFFLVPFKVSLLLLLLVLVLVAVVIQMDPMPKWSRNQSLLLDDNAVKDGFRSSAS
jgi:hypothetical protein